MHHRLRNTKRITILYTFYKKKMYIEEPMPQIRCALWYRLYCPVSQRTYSYQNIIFNLVYINTYIYITVISSCQIFCIMIYFSVAIFLIFP